MEGHDSLSVAIASEKEAFSMGVFPFDSVIYCCQMRTHALSGAGALYLCTREQAYGNRK